MLKDNQGRITQLEEKDEHVSQGHSVCNVCGKDMPGVWEIVCNGCNKTFCYDHARVRKERWYCPDC